MMTSLLTAPAEIVHLVELFKSNYDQYRSPAFTEAAVRHQFIDPFFAALGWDVNNTQGFAEQYKEVIHEDKVKVGSATKAPDYSFRIGKERKFFVEAKKPAVDIQYEIDPAYQLRRYAWSAKLPLSILTDFEQLSVYDCRSKPAATDKPSAGRILLLSYREYPSRWDEIAGVFGKAAVWQGALDKFAEAKAGKRGTAEVDDEFLAEIERWRELLARNLALRNPALRGRDLNWAVQQIIDRIVFLRICEARDLETFEQLRGLLNGGQTYERLQELFRRADMRYNSGLFHFEHERDRAEAPDTLTPGLAVDDKVLKDIIGHLYYPQSPYEFSVLPADILGHVYERFLGKVIRLTPGRQVKVEEKPEVRKAGGVFYTPTYIVDYIVRQTVGPLVDGKTPAHVGGAGRHPERRPHVVRTQSKDAGQPLRILDPACGSGSFLLGAYQFLLDWHLQEYLKEPERWLKGRRPPLERASSTNGGGYRLSIEERKRILMNNIYGVDIDPQAVEVTKLSLLLKVLEGEGMASQMSFLPERVLPDLGRNIKCGNSLIGPDFYDGKLDLPDEDTVRRVNAFDWNAEFPDAMAAGGFDAVIGNPPYGAFLGDDEKAYVRHKFQSYQYRYDSYIYFIEKAIQLARLGGYVSFITPELWLRLEGAGALRAILNRAGQLLTVRLWGERVFKAAVVSTVTFVFQTGANGRQLVVEDDHATWNVALDAWRDKPESAIEYRIMPSGLALVRHIRDRSQPLSSLGNVVQGITAYDRYRGQTPEIIRTRAYHFDFRKDDSCGKWLSGKDVTRYSTSWGGEWLSYGPWLAAPRDPSYFSGPRLLFREIPGANKRVQATYVEDTLYYGHSITPFLLSHLTPHTLQYLLGLCNSRLLSWYGGLTLPNFGKDAFPKLNPQDIKQLPIRTIDFADSADVARHDRMVALVTQMLDLHKRLAAEGAPPEKAALQRRIEMTDRQIDALVYELYGLTEEEIKVVEGTADAPARQSG